MGIKEMRDDIVECVDQGSVRVGRRNRLELM